MVANKGTIDSYRAYDADILVNPKANLSGLNVSIADAKSLLDEFARKYTGESIIKVFDEALAEIIVSYDAGMLFTESIEEAHKSSKICYEALQKDLSKRLSKENLVDSYDCSMLGNKKSVESYWNDAKRAPRCRCRPGYVQKNDENGARCVKKGGDDGKITGACRGSVWPNKSSGYHDEPLRFTIKIEPPESRDVGLVTTSNPMSENDEAVRIREGVWVLDTWFTGKGVWSLKFIAYDKRGRVMCSGSSQGMRSLGDR